MNPAATVLAYARLRRRPPPHFPEHRKTPKTRPQDPPQDRLDSLELAVSVRTETRWNTVVSPEAGVADEALEDVEVTVRQTGV